jgi:hypothetical protein
MPIKWCCYSFENLYNNKGNRSFSIILNESTKKVPLFLMQFRAIEVINQSGVKSEHPFSLEGNIGLIYCSSCGKKLSNYYKKYLDELIQYQFNGENSKLAVET